MSTQNKISPKIDTINLNDNRKSFLQIFTLPEKYIEDSYINNPSLISGNYHSRIKQIIEDNLNSKSLIAPYMHQRGYVGQVIIENDIINQMKWLLENNLQRISELDIKQAIVKLQIEFYRPEILFLSNSTYFDKIFIDNLSYKPKLIISQTTHDQPIINLNLLNAINGITETATINILENEESPISKITAEFERVINHFENESLNKNPLESTNLKQVKNEVNSLPINKEVISSNIQNQCAKLLFNNSKMKAVIMLLDNCENRIQLCPDLGVLKSLAFLKEKRIEECLNVLNILLTVHPKHQKGIEILNEVASLNMQNDQFSQSKSSDEIVNNLIEDVNLKINNKNFTDALYSIKKAILFKPDSIELLSTKALLHYHLNQDNEALETANFCLELSPDNANMKTLVSNIDTRS